MGGEEIFTQKLDSLFTISSCSALTINVLIGQGDKKLKSYKFTGGAIKINPSTSGLLIRV